MRWTMGVGAAALVCGLAVAAGAETPAATDTWRDHVTPVLSERVRGEFVDWFQPPAGAAPTGASRYNFFGSQLRFGAKVDVPHLEVVVVGQYTQLANLPDDASLGAPFGSLGPGATYFALSPHLDRDNTAAGAVFLKEGHLTLRDLPGVPGLRVTGGRFEYGDGLEVVPSDPALAWVKRARIGERLIGPFGYTHVTRSFDGLRGVYDQPWWNLTAMALRPTRGGFEIDANGGISDIGLAGVTATLKQLPDAPPLDARLFYFYYDDRRFSEVDPPPVMVDNRPLAVRSADHGAIAIHTFGAHGATVVPAGPGRFDALLWAVAQTGSWGAQSHGAWAFAVEGGYQLPSLPGKPWLRTGYDQSSGDDDPDDSVHHTFFQLIPTARIYAQTPFYNLMNSQDIFTQLLLTPHARVTVRADWHLLRLSEPKDLWYAGGGASNEDVFGYSGTPAHDHRNLAQLLDLGVTVSILQQLSAYAYYGHAFGQGVVGQTFAGTQTNYGYVELTYRY